MNMKKKSKHYKLSTFISVDMNVDNEFIPGLSPIRASFKEIRVQSVTLKQRFFSLFKKVLLKFGHFT